MFALQKNLLSHRSSAKVGVVDIGSNSIRLVIYDGLKRSPLPVLNEKILCGLAKGMGETGKLNPQGVESARKALRRFKLLAESMGVKNFYALATSAVRDATDGDEFRRQIEKENDIKVTVISGEQEARYSTLGIASSIYQGHGIVGDLGGGSFELSYIKSKDGEYEAGGFQSFPIGPLRFRRNKNLDRANTIEFINGYLNKTTGLDDYKGGNFYAVGGGFRALAKIHIQRHKYPIKVLHNYIVSSASLMETIEYVIKAEPSKLRSLHMIPPSRAETLSFTALLASRLISIFKFSNFVFSVYGIREGFLFDQLGTSEQKTDPLIASSIDMIENISTDQYGLWSGVGQELFEWMSPLFPKEKDNMKRLRLAACILSRLAWYEHTEYRAEMAFRMIVDGELSGMDHKERVFLATAVYHRYKTKAEKNIISATQKLINRESSHQASIIGLALRLGLNICGGAAGVLKNTGISLEKDKLVLFSNKKSFDLIGETVEKRLEKLAKALKLAHKVKQL